MASSDIADDFEEIGKSEENLNVNLAEELSRLVVESDEEEPDKNLVEDLRKSLLSDCSLQTVQRICDYNPLPDSFRVDIWKVCLGVKKKETEPLWDVIFDLPEQALIRQDCQNLVDRLGNEEEDKLSVVCDIESVITKFCRETGQTYSSQLKWLELLEPLVALNLEKTDLYSLFRAIQKTYIHRNLLETYNPFHLYRLLLLYHAPELCLFLDTKKISPDFYAFDWFASLFSSKCFLKFTQMMWDIYFQHSDPFFIYFLSLVIVINASDDLLQMKDADKQSIIDYLSCLPSDLEADDIKDFCSVAFLILTATPLSFKKIYYSVLFHNVRESALSTSLSQALCLPVLVQDLVLKSHAPNRVKFFVVDCRPADQYNSGHLSTAFHLDASLMLQEPAAFGTAVDALLAAKDQAIAANSVAAGDQICFMGSGREEEDQYVHMVIASFLQKHQKYVSLAYGGYAVLHGLLADNLDAYLTNHIPKSCLVCNTKATLSNGIEEKENSLFDRLASAVRVRSGVVKERLVEYITNPQTSEDRHVSCSDRLGKRYRGISPVFSIDDEHEVGQKSSETEEETFEEVNVETWKNKSDVIGSFECSEFTENGTGYPSHLIVTDTHMYILRLNSLRKGYAFIIARRPLVNIIKITSKRRCPEFITLKHGTSEDDSVTAVDHLLIPKAGDATHLIKYHIYEKTDVLPAK